MIYLIDGYNVIRGNYRFRILEERSLFQGRDALVKAIESYFSQSPRKSAVIVFDGRTVSAKEVLTSCKKIKILYPEGEADALLKQIIIGSSRDKRPDDPTVLVSDDREIVRIARSHSIRTMSATVFWETVSGKIYRSPLKQDVETDGGGKPSSDTFLGRKITEELKNIWVEEDN